MRNNQPVTQQEYLLPDGMTIVSRTDPKGRITYIAHLTVEHLGGEVAERHLPQRRRRRQAAAHHPRRAPRDAEPQFHPRRPAGTL